MRQVITEREEVHRMSSKNKTEVLIDGKIYTLSGYESEEYLQRVATYINNKLAELKKLDGYARLSQELKSILLELNVILKPRIRWRWSKKSWHRKIRNCTI